MRVDVHEAVRVAGRVAALGARTGLLPAAGAGLPRLAMARICDGVAMWLSRSPAPERHAVAEALAAASRTGDWSAAAALLATAGRRPDARAEKIVSRRYGFVWICNPKAASRSMIAALRRADPSAELIRGRTLDEALARRPWSRNYFRFAFMRHPITRAYACYADKHTLALRDRAARRWFIEPFYGLRTGMTFEDFCRWLATPFGADGFADRHWLSQHRQLCGADGRLPDFIGRFENLDADWREACALAGIPCRGLPHLNAGRAPAAANVPDAACAALLRRRYETDVRLGGYETLPPTQGKAWGARPAGTGG